MNFFEILESSDRLTQPSSQSNASNIKKSSPKRQKNEDFFSDKSRKFLEIKTFWTDQIDMSFDKKKLGWRKILLLVQCFTISNEAMTLCICALKKRCISFGTSITNPSDLFSYKFAGFF